MTALTVGLVTRHFQSRAGGWDPAMLDISQDHALCHLSEQGLFANGLVFKGGTALRKCRAGPAGRFSTDLDFAANSPDVVADVLLHLDGLGCHGFTFTLTDMDEQAGRAALDVTAPLTRRAPHPPGLVGIGSKVELSPRRPWLEPDKLPMLPSGTHQALGHELPVLPIMSVTESVAEKLARYSRVALARDLYDLWWYGLNEALDESAIRSLWVRKVYGDVVVDGRWRRPFEPADILLPRRARDIDEESIGFLTHPADVVRWEREFRARYAFLAHLENPDMVWAACDPRQRYQYEQSIA